MTESLATAIGCTSSISGTEGKGREGKGREGRQLLLGGWQIILFFAFQIWGISN